MGDHRAQPRPARQVRDRDPRRDRGTEAILRRFTRNASHPGYQAMLELGRARKTIFIAPYLRDRDLQREINEGLNLIESWNRINASSSSARAVSSRPTAATSSNSGCSPCTSCKPPPSTSHPDDSRHPRRTRMAGRVHRRRPTRSDRAVLGAPSARATPAHLALGATFLNGTRGSAMRAS